MSELLAECKAEDAQSICAQDLISTDKPKETHAGC